MIVVSPFGEKLTSLDRAVSMLEHVAKSNALDFDRPPSGDVVHLGALASASTAAIADVVLFPAGGALGTHNAALTVRTLPVGSLQCISNLL